MSLGRVSQLVRHVLPTRLKCQQCGRNADNRHRQIWSQGRLFCSTGCCEKWHGQELYFH